MNGVDLRPLSLGELLDRTFSLYRTHFWMFVGIVALPHSLVLIVQLSAEATKWMSGRPSSTGGPGGGAMLAFVVAALVGVILFLAAYVLGQAATVYAVSEIYLGRRTGIWQAYLRVRAKVWTLIGLLLMVGFAVMGGMVLLIVPGILVFLATALGVPSAVIENLKARAAISRSVALAKGNWGRIFLVFLLFFLLSWAAAMVFEFPFELANMVVLKQGQQSPLLVVLSRVGNFLASVLVGPLATIALSLVYYDARVRKEAFDLQVMMSALGPATPGASGGAGPSPQDPPASVGA